jgi:forespore regulator of the sigma-K checkpoint
MDIIALLKKLKKQLQKRLRWKRRWMNLTVIIAVLSAVTAAILVQQSGKLIDKEDKLVSGHSIREQSDGQLDSPAGVQSVKEVTEVIRSIEGEREAFSHKIYVCGEELVPVGLMKAADIMAYHKKKPNERVSIQADGKIYFTETIEDLSPRCKENAYFGMDGSGNLSLFDGVPGEAAGTVIRTFFQLNIEHLESSLPRDAIKELYRGIPVKDLSEYNSVLSTFSDYAVEATEKAVRSSSMP